MEKFVKIITPYRNEEKYLSQYLDSLVEGQKIFRNLKIILIDDFSNDKSFEIVKKYSINYNFFINERNKKKGKVNAINLGIKHLNKNDYVKFCDADDVLTISFFQDLHKILSDNIIVHDLVISDENLNKINYLRINPLILKGPKKSIQSGVIIPKACWIFESKWLLPIPDGILYEDFWFSYILKKYDQKIIYLKNKSYYLYRQNSNQTFGGVLNYNKKIDEWRNIRLIKSYTALKEIDSNFNFNALIYYYNLKLKFSFKKIIKLFFCSRNLFIKYSLEKIIGKNIIIIKKLIWKLRV